MVLTGAIFAVFENFWILLFAAVIGIVSATGGDFGPFRSIEESILSQLTTPKTRADVLSWYVVLSAVGSTVGSEVSGRTIEYLQSLEGWTLRDAYHSLFWLYAVMGIVNAIMVMLLTKECEVDASSEIYSKVPQEESEDNSIELVGSTSQRPATSVPHNSRSKPSFRSRGLFQLMGNISQPTLRIVWKLWVLLAVDSLADGMVPYSLTNYYMEDKFSPRKSTLGDVTSVSYFLTAIGGIFAGPLARKIG